jgi:hypothetical protein
VFINLFTYRQKISYFALTAVQQKARWSHRGKEQSESEVQEAFHFVGFYGFCKITTNALIYRVPKQSRPMRADAAVIVSR